MGLGVMAASSHTVSHHTDCTSLLTHVHDVGGVSRDCHAAKMVDLDFKAAGLKPQLPDTYFSFNIDLINRCCGLPLRLSDQPLES